MQLIAFGWSSVGPLSSEDIGFPDDTFASYRARALRSSTQTIKASDANGNVPASSLFVVACNLLYTSVGEHPGCWTISIGMEFVELRFEVRQE
jgi:hypothetical protein